MAWATCEACKKPLRRLAPKMCASFGRAMNWVSLRDWSFQGWAHCAIAWMRPDNQVWPMWVDPGLRKQALFGWCVRVCAKSAVYDCLKGFKRAAAKKNEKKCCKK